MKQLLFVLLIFGSVGAQAHSPLHQKLECSGGYEFEKFTADLDYTAYSPGSGYFAARNATLRDNYASASLHCAGMELSEVVCIGFMFGSPSMVVRLELVKQNGQYVAQYKMLTGIELEMHNGPWTCRIH